MITPSLLDALRKDFKNCVKSLEDKYGISMEIDKVTFGKDTFKGTLMGCERDNYSSKYTVPELYYLKHHAEHLLPGNLLDKPLTLFGESYFFRGIDSYAPKNKILFSKTHTADKLYTCSVNTFRTELNI